MQVPLDVCLARTEEKLRFLADCDEVRATCAKGAFAGPEFWESLIASTIGLYADFDGYMVRVLEVGQGRLRGQIRRSLTIICDTLGSESELIAAEQKERGRWPADLFDREEWRRISAEAAAALGVIERDGWFFEPRPTRSERQRRG
ncbi:MAG: hypothetical protein R3B68_00185 [Phycisphaerales bacterium]